MKGLGFLYTKEKKEKKKKEKEKEKEKKKRKKEKKKKKKERRRKRRRKPPARGRLHAARTGTLQTSMCSVQVAASRRCQLGAWWHLSAVGLKSAGRPGMAMSHLSTATPW